MREAEASSTDLELDLHAVTSHLQLLGGHDSCAGLGDQSWLSACPMQQTCLTKFLRPCNHICNPPALQTSRLGCGLRLSRVWQKSRTLSRLLRSSLRTLSHGRGCLRGCELKLLTPSVPACCPSRISCTAEAAIVQLDLESTSETRPAQLSRS